MKTKIISGNITKNGYVSLWEKGGGSSNTGTATIICKANGDKPVAVYIRRRGHLSNDQHALIPVHVGYFVVETTHHRGDFQHTVYLITEISVKQGKGCIKLEPISRYDCGEWDEKLPDYLAVAITAAENKARCYHCRTPFYVVSKEEKEK